MLARDCIVDKKYVGIPKPFKKISKVHIANKNGVLWYEISSNKPARRLGVIAVNSMRYHSSLVIGSWLESNSEVNVW